MRPRREVFDTYWYYAAERLAMYRRRIEGQGPPWTDDPILQEHKFCNTFRAADRVSQDLIRVAYEPAPSPADLVFRIVAYRTFSHIQGWQSIVDRLGRQPILEDLDSGDFLAAVDAAKGQGAIYTSAFILPPIPGTGATKHEQHVAMWRDQFLGYDAGDRIASAGSLENVYDILHSFPGYGDFLAYQIAVDINYSTVTDFSENDFTKPGPGAVRGQAKVFEDLGGLTPEEIIMWMVDHQDEEFERLGLDFPGLWGRRLHAIDCQGLFCETDKYSRVRFPELASNRKQIKAKFKPTLEPMQLFFPPKWGINDRVPRGPVHGYRDLGQATLDEVMQ